MLAQKFCSNTSLYVSLLIAWVILTKYILNRH